MPLSYRSPFSYPPPSFPPRNSRGMQVYVGFGGGNATSASGHRVNTFFSADSSQNIHVNKLTTSIHYRSVILSKRNEGLSAQLMNRNKAQRRICMLLIWTAEDHRDPSLASFRFTLLRFIPLLQDDRRRERITSLAITSWQLPGPLYRRMPRRQRGSQRVPRYVWKLENRSIGELPDAKCIGELAH